MSLVIKESHGNIHKFEVIFNNTRVGVADDMWSEECEYHINFDLEILSSSSEYKIKELFPDNSYSFCLDVDTRKFKNLNWINIEQSSIWFDYNDDSFVNIYPNFLEWNKSFSLLKLISELEQVLNSKNIKTDFETDLIEEGLYIKFESNSNNSILEEYNRILNMINNEVETIFKILNLSSDKELVSIFSFPNEIRQACEQYLIYFSKFLEDIGIDVTSKIDSHDKTTFFTVKPKDSKEALLNIKNLLDIYLTIPEVGNLEIITNNNFDVSAQQLVANIYHLKSQLILANSIIQNKDATIESLKFTNYQQNILLNSKSKPNEEKTLDGLITIGEYEGKGFKINLAEIFRRLKRKSKK